MILGRPLALWNALVVALGALVIGVVKLAGIDVDIETTVALTIAVVFTLLGLFANQANNGSLLGRAK
jgi:hypothetical protein